MTPPLDIAALRRLVEAASDAPWTVDDHESAENIYGTGSVPVATAMKHEDAALIAAARSAVPVLCDRVEEAERAAAQTEQERLALSARLLKVEEMLAHDRQVMRAAESGEQRALRDLAALREDVVALKQQAAAYRATIEAQKPTAANVVQQVPTAVRDEVERLRAEVERLTGKAEQWRELARNAAESLDVWSESEDCSSDDRADAIWDALTRERREGVDHDKAQPIEAAILAALDDLHHESWCYAKGRCTACDPWDDVCAALAGAGRPAAAEKLAAGRPKSIDEWRAKEAADV